MDDYYLIHKSVGHPDDVTNPQHSHSKAQVVVDGDAEFAKYSLAPLIDSGHNGWLCAQEREINYSGVWICAGNTSGENKGDIPGHRAYHVCPLHYLREREESLQQMHVIG
ncbi:hypothetical protein IAU59_006194 [Kwoniella sp. CBS 9459]